MSNSNPRVSVVMSVYNGEKYLQEAVDSILNQTFTDFEFIIVDDGSTDGTAQILDSYTDRRIVQIKNEQNIGLGYSLNEGIALARGEYIARMDADDISLPERLSIQINFMSRNKEIGLLGTMMKIIDEDGKIIEDVEWVKNLPVEPEIINWQLFVGNPIMHPTVMIRKSIFNDVKGFIGGNEPAEDYDLWIRMKKITRLANLGEELVLYRWHRKNISFINRERQKLAYYKINNAAISDYMTRFSTSRNNNIDSPSLENSAVGNQKAKTILRLYKLYVKQTRLTYKQKRIIRKDAAKRIFQIAKNGKRNLQALEFLLIACWLDMSNFLKIVILLVMKLKRSLSTGIS